MLKIVVPPSLLFNEATSEVIETKETVLTLEHSLVSISKWEAKWQKPFISTQSEHTIEQKIDYFKCMTLTQNVNPDVYNALTAENVNQIYEYMDSPMTATWFRETKQTPNRRVVTSELIYCWMINLQIPMECQKWHINRLMTLIRVCNEESANANNPKKGRMSRSDINARNELNAARRKARNSKG